MANNNNGDSTKVEVVEQMPDERFNLICDVGAELVGMIRRLVLQRGLNPDDAVAVISVAAAGIIKDFSVDMGSLFEGIDVSGHMWRKDDGEVIFDPPHLQEGFQPAISRTDTGTTN